MLNDRDPFAAIAALRVNGFGSDKDLTINFLSMFPSKELKIITEACTQGLAASIRQETKATLNKYFKDYVYSIREYIQNLNDSLAINEKRYTSSLVSEYFHQGDNEPEPWDTRAVDYPIENVVTNILNKKENLADKEDMPWYVAEDTSTPDHILDSRWIRVYSIKRESDKQLAARLRRVKKSLENKKGKLAALKKSIAELTPADPDLLESA